MGDTYYDSLPREELLRFEYAPGRGMTFSIVEMARRRLLEIGFTSDRTPNVFRYRVELDDVSYIEDALDKFWERLEARGEALPSLKETRDGY